MTKLVYEIDGKNIPTLESFFDQVWPLLAGCPPSGNTSLDAFNDILSWPKEPYIIVWKNSNLSRKQLGYSEISRKLEKMLNTCHSSNRGNVSRRLQEARDGKGPTIFDWLIEIIQNNEPYVTLRLE
jgi:RNAse (barnase) inhibitor barstar